MRRYRETFSRHRIVLILPIVIALLFSGWYVHKQPKTYETAMNLWFDTPAPGTSSLEQLPSGNTPALQGQAQLQEFLSTAQFLVKVGHRGPLASQLKAVVKPGTTAKQLDADITRTLQKAFYITVSGPQVVRVVMTGHYPQYMAGTLQAVADEYVAEVSGTLKTRSTSSVTYYESQVKLAQALLDSANSAVVAYQRSHPTAAPNSDPTYTQLTQAAFQAQSNLTTLQNNLQQAKLDQQNVTTQTEFHVIDPPGAPTAVSTRKHQLLIAAAGLCAGVVISILALSALTALDKTIRSEEDIDGTLGVEVIGRIRELPRRRRATGTGKVSTS